MDCHDISFVMEEGGAEIMKYRFKESPQPQTKQLPAKQHHVENNTAPCAYIA